MKTPLALLFLLTTLSVFAEWTTLENCKLAENISNDADSFLVESKEAYCGETKNRFRLYFVDAAETDHNSGFKQDRLKEQAEYWGSDDPDFALQMGVRASQLVSRLLRGGFTVYTQGEYAPTIGMPRCYALVRVKDRWLDEILVEEGLARIYGKGSDFPDGTDAKSHWRSLHELERIAKAASRNAWQHASSIDSIAISDREFQSHDAVTSRNTWIYSVKNGRKVMVIAKETVVTVVAPDEAGRCRIRFKKNGKVYEGLCEHRNLKK